MPVRKTESRVPTNFTAPDLGQAVNAEDGRCALVSYATAPIVVRRENVYVVFVTDATLAEATHKFEWTITEGGFSPQIIRTPFGEFSYIPQSTGYITVAVRILDAADTEKARLTLKQEVTVPNPVLEATISETSGEPGPGVGNLDAAQEMINEHMVYYEAISPKTPETGDGFQRFVSSIIYDGVLENTASQRKRQIGQMAVSLNEEAQDFSTLASQRIGVCGIRLALLAMIVQAGPSTASPPLDWTELPEATPKRIFADEQVRQKLGKLDEAARIDLFNLARFPKSNIRCCANILEVLRDRYFTGTTFNDVLTGMNGIRAQRIVQHYRDGPLARA